MNQEIQHVNKLNTINGAATHQASKTLPLTEINAKIYEGPARRMLLWMAAGAFGGWLAVSLLTGARKGIKRRFNS